MTARDIAGGAALLAGIISFYLVAGWIAIGAAVLSDDVARRAGVVVGVLLCVAIVAITVDRGVGR